MKWQTAPAYLRRLMRGTDNAAELGGRLDAALIVVPLIDLLVYFAATGAGASAGRSQIASFIVAAASHYFLQVHPQVVAAARKPDLSLYLHLMMVTLMVLILRSGVFALLTNDWGWPYLAGILFAVIATAAVMRPGYAFCIFFARSSLGRGTGWRVLCIGVVAIAFVLRLIYSGQTELLPEEAYYWNYSRHLDFGYLDHPPMVGWLISLGTAAFGDTEFGVRISALCCGAITSFFAYRLTRNLFGEPSALLAVVLIQALPFFFLAGFLMTPDAPLTAAWVAALYFLERALIAGRAGAWWYAGVSLGMGLLSKYTICLLGLSTFIFVLLDPRSRRCLARWEPYAAVSIACLMFAPVIVWNAQNEWASFVFQTSRRLVESPQFALHKLIASVLLLLTPTGFAAAALLLVGRPPDSVSRDGSADKRRAWRFIQVSLLVPLSVFALFSLRHEVKLDWTGAPLVAAVPALAFGMVRSRENLVRGVRAWIRSAWGPTIAAMLLIYGAGLYYLAVGIAGSGFNKHVELIPVGWSDFSRQINAVAEDVERTSGTDPLIVGMDRYAIASELAFYAPDRAKSLADTSSGHLFGQVGLMYERWFPLARQQGRTLLLVAWNREDLADERVKPNIERLDPIKDGVLTRGKDVIRHYYYRVAYGYRKLPGLE
jgi:dolichol-phosphate mannosyltransferase